MNKLILALTALLLFLFASAANAQYDTLWIGTADGPSTSLDNTPFPTEVARAARTQYLVRSEVLQQLNLYPNTDIYGICLQVVDDDITDPACLVNLHTENKNEGSGNLTDFINSGLVSTANSYGVGLTTGILGLPFNITHFQWLGLGNNLIIEINYERGEEVGLSPRIMLDMDLDYTATFTGRTEQNILGHSITSNYPNDAQYGSDNSLPVLGLLVAGSTGTNERPGANRVSCFPDPASTVLQVRAPSSARSLRITDMCGRTLIEQQLTAVTATVDISALPKGCYTVTSLSAEGAVSSARFIKE